MSDPFQRLVRELDYPMVILTTQIGADGGRPSGCLIGFSSQCSLDPPLYAAWVSQDNHTHPAAVASDHLGLHFPDRSQTALARLFGEETGDEIDKFTRCRWSEGPHGVAVLDDCGHWLVGRIEERRATGDHTAFVLAPVAAQASEDWQPLGFQAVKDFHPGHPA